MTAYYNEFDPVAAQWLRELINDDLIPDGYVDERSILEVTPDDLVGYAQCHFFAGIGGWPLALRQAGWPDGRPCWTGSCPCQGWSAAGTGGGFGDPRHLWPVWYELIKACRPESLYGEQVAAADVIGKIKDDPARAVWWDVVHADLEAAHYACAAFDIPAAGVGAPHIRQRLWLVARCVADADNKGPQGWLERGHGADQRTVGAHGVADGLADAESEQRHRSGLGEPEGQVVTDSGKEHATQKTDCCWQYVDRLWCRDGKWRPAKPGIQCLVDGLPAGVVPSGHISVEESQGTSEARAARLKGYGNAICPQVAVAVIQASMEVEPGVEPG